MELNKTLIAYETKGGATEEVAQKIAATLRSKFQLQVDLVDLKRQKIQNTDSYKNIVVGSGIRTGKAYDKALKFLENHFGNQQVAFYICCGDAADSEKCANAKVKYIEGVLANYPEIKPISTEIFGGRMKMLGKVVYDYLDLSKAEAWAESLGKQFTK
ncbi:MAG: flavodoxin domain-containing protein [Candidatus Bathyarchaeia archaeon]